MDYLSLAYNLHRTHWSKQQESGSRLMRSVTICTKNNEHDLGLDCLPSNYLEETEVKHPQSKEVMTVFGTVEKQVRICIKPINFTPRGL